MAFKKQGRKSAVIKKRTQSGEYGMGRAGGKGLTTWETWGKLDQKNTQKNHTDRGGHNCVERGKN